MRIYPFPLAAALVLGIASSSYAAEKLRPAQGNRTQPRKVWTNDDLDELRARVPISIVGQEPTEASQQARASAQPSQPALPVYESRLDDPAWYAERVAALQAELDARMADLQQLRDAIALAKDSVSQAGIAMDKPSLDGSPATAIAALQAQVQEAQNQLNDLADLARQHNIQPGDLRG